MVLGGGWPLGNWGFLTRVWGPSQGVQEEGCLLETAERVRASRSPSALLPAAPTCSRRFCQRPHGLSSRMSLSSSLSSSRSRSRPRLGAGSGDAMVRRAQTAALGAIRRCRRSLPALAPAHEAQPRAEPPPPPPRAPTRASGIGRCGRATEVGGARPPLREPPPRAGARVEFSRGDLGLRGARRRPSLLASRVQPRKPHPGRAPRLPAPPCTRPNSAWAPPILGEAPPNKPRHGLGHTHPRLQPRPEAVRPSQAAPTSGEGPAPWRSATPTPA